VTSEYHPRDRRHSRRPPLPISSGRKWGIKHLLRDDGHRDALCSTPQSPTGRLPHNAVAASRGHHRRDVVGGSTSYLAANAVIIRPAAGSPPLFGGRDASTLICTAHLHHQLVPSRGSRQIRGHSGGDAHPQGTWAAPRFIPHMAQPIMWEIFPLKERGITALAVSAWQSSGADPGNDRGGWIAEHWSWLWIFYLNLPIGVVRLLHDHAFLFDASFQLQPRPRGLLGIVRCMSGLLAACSCPRRGRTA